MATVVADRDGPRRVLAPWWFPAAANSSTTPADISRRSAADSNPPTAGGRKVNSTRNPRPPQSSWRRRHATISIIVVTVLVFKQLKVNMQDRLVRAGFPSFSSPATVLTWETIENPQLPKISSHSTKNNVARSPPPPTVYWIQTSSTTTTDPAKNASILEARQLLHQWTTAHFVNPQQIEDDGNVRVQNVVAWTSQTVQEALREGRLELQNQVQLVHLNDTRRGQQQREGWYYAYEEAAKLLTHLSLLLQASREEENHRPNEILVMEDTSLLTPEFVLHFHAYQAMAPSDWTILQWTTTNVPTLEQGLILTDPWTSWLADIHGTHAYSIRQKGIHAILNSVHRHDKDTGQDIWTLGEEFKFQLLADELLFSIGGPSQSVYTSTHPWILTEELQQKIQHEGRRQQRIDNLQASMTSKLNPPTRNETVLGVMSIRFNSLERLPEEFGRMVNDAEAVCKIHRRSKCDWIIKAVKALESLDRPITPNGTTSAWDQVAAGLPSYIQLDVVHSADRFNKFEFMVSHLESMGQYDLVLFKDADQRLAGFPWATFVDRMDGAVMAGPLRQAPLESFAHLQNVGGKKSQRFRLHDAQPWKLPNRNPLWTDLFMDVQALEIPFLEMYFDVFDGPFAQWYFSQILTREFTNNDVSWGPDVTWCPAAREYQPNRTACLLVPLISLHEDSRQLGKQSNDFARKGKAQHAYFQTKFGPWYQESSDYVGYGMDNTPLDGIVGKCRTLMGDEASKDATLLSECLKRRDWKRLKKLEL